jgi:decaprenylphospho-beta-D-erythro-pentofuranosid-2-ulose 2-reductase
MNDSAPTVLILGAASDIARAVARAYGEAGRRLILAARHCERLALDAEDLRLRFQIPVELVEFDVLDGAGHAAFLDQLGALPQTVVCAVGLLGEQSRSETDFAAAEEVMRSNYLGPASILGQLANRMLARGSGCIIGISSVAGDRGRASNYVYGSAKAGFTAFLSGLRNRCDRKGVKVVTVKPGFVATRMTAEMDLPAPLTAQPEEVARAILAAERKGRDVIYVRPVWRLIMLIIRHIPEFLFKRLSL